MQTFLYLEAKRPIAWPISVMADIIITHGPYDPRKGLKAHAPDCLRQGAAHSSEPGSITSDQSAQTGGTVPTNGPRKEAWRNFYDAP